MSTSLVEAARAAARRLVIEAGIRRIERYVDSYTLALRSVELFRGLVEVLRRAAGGGVEGLGEALVAVADEIGSGAPSASPIFNVSLAFQALYDELVEAEASPRLAWLTLERLVDEVRFYLEKLPERVRDMCASSLQGRRRVAVVGGGRLLLHCLTGLPKSATVVVLEGYPERDGVALYRRLREARGDLRLVLLPDAYYWQASRDADASLVYLDGVGRDCVALARAGSRPLSLVFKAGGKEAVALTFLLAVETGRMLRGVPRPEKRLRLHERGVTYSSPIYDYVEVARDVDRVVTEVTELKPDGSTLVNLGLSFTMDIVGRAFRRATEELGVSVPPPEEDEF